MKRTKLFIALLSLSFSLSALGLGLGELKVHSSLDQAFDAEIELIDIANTPPAEIKVSLASPEDYQRLGLDRAFDLSQLTFSIVENKHGQLVVQIHSVDRISDPFMQLLVDLAWPKGQIYREYSVLLDPPHYDLVAKPIVKHAVRKRIAAEPGVVNKDVYESVGPSHTWQKDPPLTSNESTPAVEQDNRSYESTLPAAPVLAQPLYAIPPIHTFISANQDNRPSEQSIISSTIEKNPTMKAQMDVAVSAIDSIRESNASLKEQLRLLQDQNKQLQEQFNKQHAEIAVLHTQLELLLHRQGLGAQVVQPNEHEHHSHLWLWMLLLLGIGGAYFSWRKWIVVGNVETTPSSPPNLGEVTPDEPIKVPEEVIIPHPSEVSPESPPMPASELPNVESSLILESENGASAAGENPSHARDDETSLHEMSEQADSIESLPVAEVQPLEPDPIEVTELPTVAEEPIVAEEAPTHDDVHTIEFVVDPEPVVKNSPNPSEKNTEPDVVRSQAALETLLDLAQTYIDMGDITSAKESLQEVLDYGNTKQQAAAKKLLDGI